MIVKASSQTKNEYCQAVFNRILDANSICPANHDVDYCRGWYYFDGVPQQRPEITAEAVELMNDPSKCVGYWQQGNCYIIIDDPDFRDDGWLERCPNCGHTEVSDGYGCNDCPECCDVAMAVERA